MRRGDRAGNCGALSSEQGAIVEARPATPDGLQGRRDVKQLHSAKAAYKALGENALNDLRVQRSTAQALQPDGSLSLRKLTAALRAEAGGDTLDGLKAGCEDLGARCRM